jgi:lipopolysaccharide transport system ATP-binding protein
MNEIAIRVENLGKLYRIGRRESYQTMRDSLTEACTAPFRRLRSLFKSSPAEANSNNHIWALKDVSFEIKQGEVVGIIGRNGAGKSTLLKIFSRITEPTEGYAEIKGRVASLLEVGTGFHAELTGRENIYLNGAILGMRKAEIDRKFDEMVTFAEVEKFIDTPVKFYSSGMYVRLAFAVAAHLEPEILLVDEVLAVGDVEFQRKCLGKMHDVAGAGRTVLFVSHNMQAIDRLCKRGIVLREGKVDFEGPAPQAIQKYLQQTHHIDRTDIGPDIPRQGDGRARITRFEVIEALTGQPVNRLSAGQSFSIRIYFTVNEQINYPKFGFALFTGTGSRIFTCTSSDSKMDIEKIEDDGMAEVSLKDIILPIGSYLCNLAIVDRNNSYCDILREIPCFEIEQSNQLPASQYYDQSAGAIYINSDWHLKKG